MAAKLKKINYRQYGVIFAFIILCIIITIMKPSFISSRNIFNLLRQSSVIGIMSAGMTLVIICGCFDISVGYICCLSGIMTAILYNNGIPLPLVFLIVLLTGAVIGLCSGFAIAIVGIPSMIATLGMGQIVNGVLLMLSGGYPQTIKNDVMTFIGKDSILNIPVPIYIFFLSILFVAFLLKYTEFGRHVFSTGGNQEASRLCGINTKWVIIRVFMISCTLSALSGIVLTARVSTATSTAGSGYELDAIAAVVIGGTCISGGEGSAWKTIIGVLFMSVISNAFNLLQVDVFFQYILKGLIILFAVGFDCVARAHSND